MKKIIGILLVVATIIGTSVPALAAEQKIKEPIVISTNASNNQINNNLIIAGKVVNIGKIGVVINNGNIMVPLKITAESLGFKVSADAGNKNITLDNDQIKTTLEVGSDSYYYSSSHAIGCIAPVSFGAAPMVIDNVVYVPIKIYSLLFNDSNAVGSFFCKATDGELVYVNGDNYTFGHFVESKSDDVLYSIGMPNPIEEFNTVQEAQKSLKFKTIIPKEIPSEYQVKYISTISKELFQICYSNGKNDILFRMAQGIDKIDGDYTEYKFNKTIQVNGKSVNLKGNSSNLVNLATYKINDMSYSISVTNGMSKNDIIKIIKSTF